MAEDAETLARRCAEALWNDDEAARQLDLALDAVGPGTATVSMTVIGTMVNGYGVCHGGYIFTLAHTALSIASQTRNRRSAAQNCHIAFVAPGRLGERLVARARERHTAARSGIWDVAVRTSSGEAIAEFRGHARHVGGNVVGD